MQKERIQQVVDELPQEVDFDQLMERLYLLHKIDIGEKQIAEGQGVPLEEAKKRLEQWLR